MIRSFLSGVKDVGNSMSNSITKSPFFVGSADTGIPSPGTTFVYPGLEVKMLSKLQKKTAINFKKNVHVKIQIRYELKYNVHNKKCNPQKISDTGN